MNLTINILVRNNQETIEETLKSALEISDSILIGDAGTTDDTIKICKKYCSNIIPINFKRNFSNAKNQMIEQNKSWIFFLEPWEKVVSNGKLELKEDFSYKVNIIKNDLIIKETRIWHKQKKIKFKNPVFESVSDENNMCSEIYLTGENKNKKEKDDILKIWHKEMPVENEPIYFLAFNKIIEKDWHGFLNLAEIYSYKEKKNIVSKTMINYYIAMIKTYINEEKDYKESLKRILMCIKENPLMAEFWCLLGDLFFSYKEYNKSISFYENAILLGKYRLKSDDYPIEVSKYEEYPKKMIKSCVKILSSLKSYKKIN